MFFLNITPRRAAAIFARLKAFAAKGGVKVVELSDKAFEAKTCKDPRLEGGVKIAPFIDTLAIDWKRKVLYVRTPYKQGVLTLGGMVHELGHLLATAHSPIRSCESNFLGWEFRVAKKLNMFDVWETSMSNYIMSNDKEYVRLKPKERKSELALAVTEGVTLGNLTSNSFQPMFVR